MWTAKEGNVRKREFIETAIKIFKNKGYEKASINDILKEMNITKGAFYYYFKSKEVLLDEVVNELIQGIEIMIKEIAQRKDLSAVAKLEKIFKQMNQYRKDNISSYSQLYELQEREENAFIARKIMKKILSLNAIYIQNIINQGIEEGDFKTSNTFETAELYIRLTTLCKEKMMYIIADKPYRDNPEVMYKTVESILSFYSETLERILGAKEGTLNFISK